ncbi:MAG TPA: methionine--tRNA ligase [Elusimicrobiota bacterium]|nr:methionine--tRNA ligase [Elusimicrobiota bacterium]
MKTFYITTPIYYVNDVPHIGHAYTTIAADVLARWKRLCGEEVFFLTGTDEHGQNIERIAREKGVSEQVICDTNSLRFRELWKNLSIENDDFIRTTEERHAAGVRVLWDRLKTAKTPAGNPAVFKKKYAGLYCPRCEAFKTEDELNQPGNLCPDHGLPCEMTEEENYFFRLSDYADWFRGVMANKEMTISPESRRNEVMGVVQQGLQDFSISRARVKWGIPIPDDPEHVFYVWVDALSNYITALGFAATGEKRALYERFWEKGADRLHLIGKEIIRFHCLYWPAMLQAAGLPLPTRVFAHGWWTVEGEKMSKTRGNVVDPRAIVEEYGGPGIGVDVLRYFVLREVPFGNDGDFSRKALLNRYNAELANALGNLLNRTLQLLEKNNEGKIPPPSPFSGGTALENYQDAMERLAFGEALESALWYVNEGNLMMDREAPWKTVKTDREAALRTLFKSVTLLKTAAILLSPFMPAVMGELWKQLGERESLETAGSRFLREGVVQFAPGQTVQKGAPLFPRKEVK